MPDALLPAAELAEIEADAHACVEAETCETCENTLRAVATIRALAGGDHDIRARPPG